MRAQCHLVRTATDEPYVRELIARDPWLVSTARPLHEHNVFTRVNKGRAYSYASRQRGGKRP